MAAYREARIEWFSGNSNHDGGIFTRSDFRSQALFQHSTQDITPRTPHIPFNVQAPRVSQTLAGTPERKQASL
jgi:hypothetical protein